jgi:hypothetical protein
VTDVNLMVPDIYCAVMIKCVICYVPTFSNINVSTTDCASWITSSAITYLRPVNLELKM